MNPYTWNKLLDLLRLALMSPCRTKADADKIDAQIDELRREVEYENGNH